MVRLTAFTFRGSTLGVKDPVERPPNLKLVNLTPTPAVTNSNLVGLPPGSAQMRYDSIKH